ncbi:MAG: hypothetical protein AAGC67_07780 [Myxococcota bacterium]
MGPSPAPHDSRTRDRRDGDRASETAPRHLTAPPGRRSEALEALLVDLGSQIQKGSARAVAEAPRWQATGIGPLDRLLGGGFPIGRLSEICGPAEEAPRPALAPSAGRTAVAQALVAEALSKGVLVAWIDLADAFDPDSALETIRARGDADTHLDRLLWVRARDEDEALRSCERVMRTEGFELVVFDLFRPGDGPVAKDVTWLRLARLSAATRTTLVALSDGPSTGARAELVLEMRPRRVLWSEPPYLLESIETEAVLRRHRSRPTGEKIALRAALNGGAASRTSEAC